MSNDQLEAVTAQVVERLNGKYVRSDFCGERSGNFEKRLSTNSKITLAVLGMQLPIIGLLIAIAGKLY